MNFSSLTFRSELASVAFIVVGIEHGLFVQSVIQKFIFIQIVRTEYHRIPKYEPLTNIGFAYISCKYLGRVLDFNHFGCLVEITLYRDVNVVFNNTAKVKE